MKDYNSLINKLLRISEDMHWELLTEAAMAIRELQQDAARYQWLREWRYPELCNEMELLKSAMRETWEALDMYQQTDNNMFWDQATASINKVLKED